MRTVVAGGSVFDGTGAPAARADVAMRGSMSEAERSCPASSIATPT
jgi:N-acyl-D-aspartate/D-glutamate deacylase